MRNYRKQLEGRKNEILGFLTLPDAVLARGQRSQLIREYGEIEAELLQMDEGTHWTQTQGDTLHKIVVSELQSARKVSKL